MKTPWRNNLYKQISKISMPGKVLDLGGARKSGYQELIGGKPSFTVVNIDGNKDVDIAHNIEKPLPIPDATYDGVLLINVLEHIYDHRALLLESARVLKKGGKIAIGVPFVVQIHPSPNDHWRYTYQTLERLMSETGFKNTKVTPVGFGPFTSSAQLLYNPLKISVLRFPVILAARCLDAILARLTSKEKMASTYPLGYFVFAERG